MPFEDHFLVTEQDFSVFLAIPIEAADNIIKECGIASCIDPRSGNRVLSYPSIVKWLEAVGSAMRTSMRYHKRQVSFPCTKPRNGRGSLEVRHRS